MIIFEGCDGSGKTTLINQLREDLDLPIGDRILAKRDEIWKNTREDTYNALSEAVMGYLGPSLWDRLGPFSDPIYSRVMGRECQFKQSEIIYCRAVIQALKCPVIICHLPLQIVQDNVEGTDQMEGVIDKLADIHGQYIGLINYLTESLPNVHTYDYRVENSYRQLVEDVIKPYLIRRKDREWHL